MLTTGIITQTVPMPICRYQVLQGNEAGPPMRFARIGERAYHRWKCEGPSDNIFCMTVHSCHVDNGGGTKFPLLDSEGCAQDRFLMTNIDYTGDLVGGQTSMVFKFADKPSVFFDCQIRLTLKNNDVCRRTSDVCREPLRGKREASVANILKPNKTDASAEAMEVYSGEIVVISDFAPPSDSSSQELSNRLHTMNMQGAQAVSNSPPRSSVQKTHDFCLPKSHFALSIVTSVMLVLALLGSLFFLAFRCRYRVKR